MFAWLLVVQLATVITWDHYDRQERHTTLRRLAYHDSVLTGTAPSETRARVLAPWVAEFAARGFQGLPGIGGGTKIAGHGYSGRTFDFAYMMLNWSAILLLLRSMFLVVQRFHGLALGLFGTTLSAVTAWFTFRDQYYHPWSPWEAGFFALGMYLIQTGRHKAFVALCIPAAALRETTAFLPFAFLILGVLETRRPGRASLAAMGVWTLVFVFVRLAVGYDGPSPGYFSELWRRNMEALPYTLLLNGILLGPLWFYAIRGIRLASPIVNAFAISMACYASLLVTVTFWWEIRYWMTAIPALVPLIIESAKKDFQVAFFRDRVLLELRPLVGEVGSAVGPAALLARERASGD